MPKARRIKEGRPEGLKAGPKGQGSPARILGPEGPHISSDLLKESSENYFLARCYYHYRYEAVVAVVMKYETSPYAIVYSLR